MNWLEKLARRRPDLFNQQELNKILAADRWAVYERELNRRCDEFVIAEKAKDVLNGRTRRKLLPAGTTPAPR